MYMYPTKWPVYPNFHCSTIYNSQDMVTQMVKNPPAMWETQVQSLGREDPLEKEWQPTEYPCLENPIDRGD